LGSLRRTLAALFMQAPVWMQPIKIAVRTDHLRLDPEAEIHAKRGHTVDQRAEALWEAGGIDFPVAERCSVVAAAAEPAVVRMKRSAPRTCRGLGQFEEPLLVDIEISGFPGVEVHLSWPCSEQGRGSPRAKLPWNEPRMPLNPSADSATNASGVA
jgi:hypothetical protein